MDKDSRSNLGESPGFFGETWFDPIEIAIRGRIRGFIEALVDAELNEALGRRRYQRPGRNPGTDGAQETVGYRHGRRERQLLGSFGPVAISVPRARVSHPDGTSHEW